MQTDDGLKYLHWCTFNLSSFGIEDSRLKNYFDPAYSKAGQRNYQIQFQRKKNGHSISKKDVVLIRAEDWKWVDHGLYSEFRISFVSLKGEKFVERYQDAPWEDEIKDFYWLESPVLDEGIYGQVIPVHELNDYDRALEYAYEKFIKWDFEILELTNHQEKILQEILDRSDAKWQAEIRFRKDQGFLDVEHNGSDSGNAWDDYEDSQEDGWCFACDENPCMCSANFD